MTPEIYTFNSRQMAASPDHVYALAVNVLDWPALLSHYRYVRLLNDGETSRTVAMGAARSRIPVRWTAVQEMRPESREIRYRHIAGVTRGMDVMWRIDSSEGGARATITHRLQPQRRWLRLGISRWVVGRLFVMAIAERTLAGIAARAEGDGNG